MNIAITQNMNSIMDSKIKSAINLFKLSKIEKMLSDVFENFGESSTLNYIGEFNKYDIMD